MFASGGSEGTAQTGRWVNIGARFYLQDVTGSASGITVATLTIHAGAVPSDPVHYVAAASNLTASPSSEAPGAVLVFERDTLDLLWRLNFPATVAVLGTSPDRKTLPCSSR